MEVSREHRHGSNSMVLLRFLNAVHLQVRAISLHIAIQYRSETRRFCSPLSNTDDQKNESANWKPEGAGIKNSPFTIVIGAKEQAIIQDQIMSQLFLIQDLV